MQDTSTRFGDVRKVAEITGLSRGHLNNLRIYRPEDSPPFVRVGSRIRYPLTGPVSLETWMMDRLVNGGAANG